MDNFTVTTISTTGNGNETETVSVWTSVSTVRLTDEDGSSSTGLIVGLLVAALVIILLILAVLFARKKLRGQLPTKSAKNGAMRSSEQVMFVVAGSNRSSQISGFESPPTNLQGHPIDPVCSFDEYVDIDPSATIEQPNNLQHDYAAVDLQPVSIIPAFDVLSNTVEDDEEPEFLKDKDMAANVNKIGKPSREDVKERVVLNSNRKFSLQELKADEAKTTQSNKRRNKSLPTLTENIDVDMRTDVLNSETKSDKNVAVGCIRNKAEEGHKRNDFQNVENSKVSSLRSVLLEVDAYENIEFINNQNKKRGGVTSMKEQSVHANLNQVPMRRAMSEQTKYPVPQPRTNANKKRKTFDPYDYPPGVPIPKELLEEEESEDSQYVPHDPFADEIQATKRKTFDPYDYPPGHPVPKQYKESVHPEDKSETSNQELTKLENDAEPAIIETSGVYVAYDPDNTGENGELVDEAGGEYINCNDVFLEDENFTDNLKITGNEVVKTESLNNSPAPPAPCSGPYYVNDPVNIFDTDNDKQEVTNKLVASEVKNNVENHAVNYKDDDENKMQEDNKVPGDNSYYNIIVTGNQQGSSHEIDKTVSESPSHSAAKQTLKPTQGVSKSDKSTPRSDVSASKDIQLCQPNDGGIYQNLVPAKPRRLHQSVEKLSDTNNSERNGDNTEAGAVSSVQKDDSQEEDTHNYEAVLVVNKRKEPEQNIDHGYANIKRFS